MLSTVIHKNFILSAPPARRGRTQLTIAGKKEIVKYKFQHPKARQEAISIYFSQKWGKKVGRSTISDILKYKEKWLSKPKDCDNALRQRSGMYANLESALFKWYSEEVRSENANVSEDVMVAKAKQIGMELNIENFQYSSGWLHKFKQRHNIPINKRHNNSRRCDIVFANQDTS